MSWVRLEGPPTLGPLESAIFDEDVITDLEEHFGDDVVCTACGKPAEVHASIVCCGDHAEWCGDCLLNIRIRVNVGIGLGRGLRCGSCTKVSYPHEFEDLINVVPL